MYQGQWYVWKRQPRGSVVTAQPASAFVFYLQNHDQVANHPSGSRILQLTSPSRYRALAALLLLAPETPLLFMGQEYGIPSPFVFFADHKKSELHANVFKGRKQFLAQFPSYATAEAQGSIPDPAAAVTVEQCKLDDRDRRLGAGWYRFHQDLLQLRREDSAIAAQALDTLEAAVLSPHAFLVRYADIEGRDRLLLINLGGDLLYTPQAEPLLAPPHKAAWEICWCSESPCYGGSGAVDPRREDGCYLVAESTYLLAAGRQGL